MIVNMPVCYTSPMELPHQEEIVIEAEVISTSTKPLSSKPEDPLYDYHHPELIRKDRPRRNALERLTSQDWKGVKSLWDDPDSKVEKIAEAWNIGKQAIYEHAIKFEWKPRSKVKVEDLARKRLEGDPEMVKFEKRYKKVTGELLTVMEKLVEKTKGAVEAGEVTVKSVKDIESIMNVMDRVCEKHSKTNEPPVQQNLFMDFGLLASRPSREELIEKAREVQKRLVDV